jgi:membrane protein DedA with SNARE-associated domain
MGYFYSIVDHLHPYIVAYGAVAIFVVVYLESFGMPLPGETAVISASFLAAHGELAIVPLFLAVLAGAILGDSTGYGIGRVGGHALLRRVGPLVKLTPERLEQVETNFRERGVPVVMTARFVPLLRQLNGLIAGTMEMPWLRFLFANAVGAVLWTSVWTLGPYFFGSVFRALR